MDRRLDFGQVLAWGLASILQSKPGRSGAKSIDPLVFQRHLFLTPFVLTGAWKTAPLCPVYPVPRVCNCAIYDHGAGVYVSILAWDTTPSRHCALAVLRCCRAIGIEAAVRWIARRRKTWELSSALPIFQAGFAALAILFQRLST